MDTYCEHILKKKKSTIDYIIIAITAFLAIILLYVLTGIMTLLSLTFFMPVIWFGIIWGAFKIICRTNIEYEYLLTGGDLDVDKIMNRSKRAHVISLRRREIEFIAPLGSGKIPTDWQTAEKIDVASGYNPNSVYALGVNKEGRKLVLFEPTEKMMEQLKLKFPGKVFF